MTRAARTGQRGFSLVELMVVVAIIGISASLAVMVNKVDPTAKSSRELAAFLQQARRTAIGHGASAAPTITATSRVTVDEVNGHTRLTLFELDDSDPADPVWTPLGAPSILAKGVQITRMATVANTNGGETLPTAIASGATVEAFFYPNGTATARTFYLQTRDAAKPEKFRVFVMPLSGIPTTTKGW